MLKSKNELLNLSLNLLLTDKSLQQHAKWRNASNEMFHSVECFPFCADNRKLI